MCDRDILFCLVYDLFSILRIQSYRLHQRIIKKRYTRENKLQAIFINKQYNKRLFCVPLLISHKILLSIFFTKRLVVHIINLYQFSDADVTSLKYIANRFLFRIKRKYGNGIYMVIQIFIPTYFIFNTNSSLVNISNIC